MRHVTRLGWTHDALAASVAEHGLSPAAVGMFPRGAIELVEHHMESCNARLPAALLALDIHQLRSSVFVSFV